VERIQVDLERPSEASERFIVLRTIWGFDLKVTAWRSTGLGSIEGFEAGFGKVGLTGWDGIDLETGNLAGKRKALEAGATRRAIGSRCCGSDGNGNVW